MSIKHFCDVCKAELTPTNHFNRNGCGRVAGQRPAVDLGIQIITSWKHVFNAGDFCNHCIYRVAEEVLRENLSQEGTH